MNIDYARHLRITRLTVDDDFVNKRSQAINELADSFQKIEAPHALTRLANAIVNLIRSPAPVRIPRELPGWRSNRKVFPSVRRR